MSIWTHVRFNLVFGRIKMENQEEWKVETLDRERELEREHPAEFNELVTRHCGHYGQVGNREEE